MRYKMEPINPQLIHELRVMARGGKTPSQMFSVAKSHLGIACHILDIIHHFREAFCLSLAEAKPLACVSDFTETNERQITDTAILDSLILPYISGHKREWDTL